MIADMGTKITVTAEKDGRTVIFEGSGTLTTTERVGKWVEARPTSTSRDVHGVEIEWDGTYTIREADHRHVTLDDLAAAWEAAEIPTDDAPIREGDTLIFRGQQGDFAVFEQAGIFLKRHIHGARILSRAPRAPWQDLADVLDKYRPTPDEMLGWGDDHLAAYLHERGVRVTGGEES